MVVMEEGEAQSEWHQLKEEGNKLFKDGSHLKAAAAYTTAIKVFKRSCFFLIRNSAPSYQLLLVL